MKKIAAGLLALSLLLTSCTGGAGSSSKVDEEVVIAKTATTTTAQTGSSSDISSAETTGDESKPTEASIYLYPTTDWENFQSIVEFGLDISATGWDGKDAYVAVNDNITKLCDDDNIDYIVSYLDINTEKCEHKILHGGFIIYPSGKIIYQNHNRRWHNRHR